MEENKKTNIAEFLLNAPKGLTLYSPIVGNVIFDEVENRTWNKEEGEGTNLLIFTHIPQKVDTLMVFYEDGRYRVFNQDNNGECLLFPSKENKTWDFWQQSLFKHGDFVYDDEMEECFFLGKSIDGDELEMRDCVCVRRYNDFRSLRYANKKEIAHFKENLLQYGFYFDENDQSVRMLNFDQDATPTKEKYEERTMEFLTDHPAMYSREETERLRQHLAGMAMQGMLARYSDIDYNYCAREAIKYADALMTELESKGNE